MLRPAAYADRRILVSPAIGGSLRLTKAILSILGAAMLLAGLAACGDSEFKDDWPGGVLEGKS